MTAAPRPLWLSPLAKCYVALTFALILVGGMVTTSGAGMAFETWPLSDGSVNPPGWTQNMLKALEHSHRLIATLTAVMTAVVCCAVWKNWSALAIGPLYGLMSVLAALLLGANGALASTIGMGCNVLRFTVELLMKKIGRRDGEASEAVGQATRLPQSDGRLARSPAASGAITPEQKLSLAAAWLVSLQAIFGGLRVLIEAQVSPEAAIIFRVFHAITAQAFLVLVVILAARLSPVWAALAAQPHPRAGKFRSMAVVLLGLYFAQLACAAYLRHRGIGLLIPSWPTAQPGSLLPVAWSHDIAIHFIHTRILPILIAGHVIGLAIGTAKCAAGFPRLTRVGWALLALVCVQFTLGVLVIWKVRHAHITNTHVVVGAAFCATAALYFARAGRLRVS